jgi:hypothetical protein
LIFGKIFEENLLPATKWRDWIDNDDDDDGDKDTRKARPEIVSCSKSRPLKRRIVIHHLLVTVMFLEYIDRCRVIQKIYGKSVLFLLHTFNKFVQIDNARWLPREVVQS